RAGIRRRGAGFPQIPLRRRGARLLRPAPGTAGERAAPASFGSPGVEHARGRAPPGAALLQGLKQRLGLAQAILGRPKLLILDEPTADFDPRGRRDVRALIERLKQSGVAILLNSHLLSEVELVCDTVAIMGKGRVLKEGTMQEVVPEGRNLEDVFVELFEAASPKRDQLPSFIDEGQSR